MVDSAGIQAEKCMLDWLAFSLPFEDGLATVEDLFGAWEERPRGTRGYSNSGTLPCGGTVSWSPKRATMKVHVELSSTQLATAIELQPALADLRGFLKYLFDLDASFTRVDFAWDDRTGQLDMATIGQHVAKKWLTSRWRKGRHIEGTMDAEGETFEFGKRVSESFLRIYDKQAERIDKGEDDPGHWVRVELELKGDRANIGILDYLLETETFLQGMLRGLLEFREPCADDTKSRWPVCAWWTAFLDWAEVQRLYIPKAEPSVERSWDWLSSQCTRSLARVLLADGGDMARMYELIEMGKNKLTQKDQSLVDAYQQVQAPFQAENVRSAA